jgi:hypothetical protein
MAVNIHASVRMHEHWAGSSVYLGKWHARGVRLHRTARGTSTGWHSSAAGGRDPRISSSGHQQRIRFRLAFPIAAIGAGRHRTRGCWGCREIMILQVIVTRSVRPRLQAVGCRDLSVRWVKRSAKFWVEDPGG